jgi:non-ribosomal peptide synthetase component E (peptide arylation enzyme)
LARRHLIDGAAYYSIDGRIQDVINRGVEKIHAEEVEELLMRHPAIANAALVAMPDYPPRTSSARRVVSAQVPPRTHLIMN